MFTRFKIDGWNGVLECKKHSDISITSKSNFKITV